MQYEVELKFRLDEKAESIVARLLEFGATEIGEVRQADHYFNHPVRDFATTDEALRIRSVGDQNWLTWKGPKLDQQTKTRREIEPALGDGSQTADEIAEVLTILGFHSVAVVRKVRRRFGIERGGRHFELAFDRVDGVGEFLEVELLAEKVDLKSAQQALKSLCGEIGLEDSAVERKSYLRMLLES
ncbi:MAG: class IV adenylate cyclase [Planctomycetota bacterium]|nr:class IV adenylate cyclase [Planctomycetota bacterium]MDA0919896.1 class IV adenylate cyclase [Planctomycetota bacterium]MDA1161258.1 class IV adenylate cyclase [Planctomycetota bacterium]